MDNTKEGTVLEQALAADLREVADMLEHGNMDDAASVLMKNLPAYLFAHVGNWAGALVTDLLKR
jgi:hypothetical protein